MKMTVKTTDLIERIGASGRIARRADGVLNIDAFIGALWASLDIVEPELGKAFAKAADAEHLLKMKREA